MEKESIVLERGDSAVEFWHTLFNYSMCKHYNPVTKTWQDDRQDDDSPEYKEWASRLAIYRDLQDLAIDFAACDDLSLVNKQGKLLKRFAKYIKKTINAELDSRMAGIIGDKIQSFLTNARCEFTFDFANVIDWDDGYFGHSGSCWWDEYSESRATFDNAGGYSIRFYRDEFDRRGIGRTWVLPYNGALVCFNSYGVDRPKVIQVLKQVFKQHGITLEHKCLEVNNDEDSPGSICCSS